MMIEPEMGSGDACSPHNQDDSEVIELVAEFVHVGAVVRERVEDGREDEADDDSSEVDAHSKPVLEY
jgi:hypothetical protein